MSSRVQGQTPPVPIRASDVSPIEGPGQSVVQQAVGSPSFGPVMFAQTAETQAIRSTLSGVRQNIDGAVRAANDLSGSTSFAQLAGRLRTIEKGLASNALSKAWMDGTLSHEEDWATGLDFGRSLRTLSQALAAQMDGLTEAQTHELDTLLSNIRAALGDSGVGGLPSVRLPPPLPTSNAQGLRLETDDLALLKFAASVPEGLRPVLDEILRANPGDPLNVLDILAAKDDPIAELKRLDLMFAPGDAKAARANLSADLAYRGATIEADAQAMLEGFGVKDTGPLFDMFSTAREAFKRGAKGSDEVEPNSMDQPGWIHTRLEMPHSLEGLQVVQGALPDEQSGQVNWPRLAKGVWLGTLASDLYKKEGFGSVLTHNRDGAELMVPLLASRHLGDLDTPENHTITSQAKRFAHDHQIMPAPMMGMLANFYLTSDEHAPSIVSKISNPFAAPSEAGELIFDEGEQAALRDQGISGWAVLSAENDLERLVGGLAVILGDAAQYGCEDAAAKYGVALRGPEKFPGLQNPVISSRAFEILHPKRTDELASGNGIEERRGGMESALEGSHGDCLTTLDQARGVLGEHLATTAAEHLDRSRDRFTSRVPELTEFVDARLREQTGDRAVHYWDTLVPPRDINENLPTQVNDDIKLVKAAFAEAIDVLFKVPPKPFEIEGGSK